MSDVVTGAQWAVEFVVLAWMYYLIFRAAISLFHDMLISSHGKTVEWNIETISVSLAINSVIQILHEFLVLHPAAGYTVVVHRVAAGYTVVVHRVLQRLSVTPFVAPFVSYGVSTVDCVQWTASIWVSLLAIVAAAVFVNARKQHGLARTLAVAMIYTTLCMHVAMQETTLSQEFATTHADL